MQPTDRGRWSSQKKTEVVLRLLRGEDLDAVSRELKVGAATLSRWRDEFVAGGRANLKSRDDDARDDEIRRLKTKLGEITMENELLREQARRHQANLPLSDRTPTR